MLADVRVETGAEQENRLLPVHVIEPLKRIVDCIVEARFAVGRDTHAAETTKQLVLVLGEVRQDFWPDVEGDESGPVLRAKAVDESGSGCNNVVVVVANR